jgi:DNA-binding CsgD family transcriptional regulator
MMTPRFRDISDSTARRIDRTMLGMAGLDTLEELEIRFIREAEKILPGDCLCWNNWAPDLSRLKSFSLNANYQEPFQNLLGVFDEVVAYHPVIAAGQLVATSEGVKRLSDFESDSRFRENPLYREVYRHLDSNHQLAYTPCVLQNQRIVLTWNRRALDFTERDREVLHFMGLRLGAISRRIEQRQLLNQNWRALCDFVDARIPTESVSSLTTQEVVLLASLLKSGTRRGSAQDLGIRGDTVDKRLGAIRERLGLENHHQLTSALAELRCAVEATGTP